MGNNDNSNELDIPNFNTSFAESSQYFKGTGSSKFINNHDS
jgi:hypothetical protein